MSSASLALATNRTQLAVTLRLATLAGRPAAGQSPAPRPVPKQVSGRSRPSRSRRKWAGRQLPETSRCEARQDSDQGGVFEITALLDHRAVAIEKQRFVHRRVQGDATGTGEKRANNSSRRTAY